MAKHTTSGVSFIVGFCVSVGGWGLLPHCISVCVFSAKPPRASSPELSAAWTFSPQAELSQGSPPAPWTSPVFWWVPASPDHAAAKSQSDGTFPFEFRLPLSLVLNQDHSLWAGTQHFPVLIVLCSRAGAVAHLHLVFRSQKFIKFINSLKPNIWHSRNSRDLMAMRTSSTKLPRGPLGVALSDPCQAQRWEYPLTKIFLLPENAATTPSFPLLPVLKWNPNTSLGKPTQTLTLVKDQEPHSGLLTAVKFYYASNN